MTKINVQYFFIVFLSLMINSCSKEEFINEDGRAYSSEINFGIVADKSESRVSHDEECKEYQEKKIVLCTKGSQDSIFAHQIIEKNNNNLFPTAGHLGSRGDEVSSTNFYNAFHIVAQWKKKNSLVGQFYMDEDVIKKGSTTGNGLDVWCSKNVYYWPGKGHVLNFYAWAPIDAQGLDTKSVSPSSLKMVYTVPIDQQHPSDKRQDADIQKDIVVASAPNLNGDYNKRIGLNFQHICTSVCFEIGKEMQEGTIKRIRLLNIQNKGTYDLTAQKWEVVGGSVSDFQQTLTKETIATTGEEVLLDKKIPEATFMMIPQTLTQQAKMEVLFYDKLSDKEYTMEAPISGSWGIGSKVTYCLSISPKYKLTLTPSKELLDAHYESFIVDVEATNLKNGWTLTSDKTKNVFFKLEEKLTELQKIGYWIDEDKGKPSIVGKGNQKVRVYVTENLGSSSDKSDGSRKIKLELKPTNMPKAVPVVAAVKQLCPLWNNNGVGYECIEEGENNYPYGFKWTRKVTYTYEGFLGFLFSWIAKNYQVDGADSYLNVDWHITQIIPPMSKATAIIDYSKLTTENGVGQNKKDGLQNTRNVFYYKNIGSVSEMETSFDKIKILGYTWTAKNIEGGDYTNIKNFAIKMAVMRNRFKKEQKTNTDKDGNTVTIEIPKIDKKDIVWYLPASEEQKSIVPNSNYPLKGKYWSSTADPNNSLSFSYDSDGVVYSTDRLIKCKIRAARKRP